MAHNRVPLQVSENFLLKLKEVQRKIRMKTGNERSLRKLTEDLVTTMAFEELEKRITKGNDVNMDIKIRMDL